MNHITGQHAEQPPLPKLSGIGTHPSQVPYWDLATELIQDRRRYRARKKRRCPICQHDHWCLANFRAALCPRVSEGSVRRYGEYGWLHVLDGSANYIYHSDDRRPQRTVQTTPPTRRPTRKWEALAKRYFEDAREKHEDKLAELAELLGVDRTALDDLGVGYGKVRGQWAWTFPEKDGSGRVIGLSYRLPNGDKRMISGGQRGLSYGKQWDRGGPVLIVEGPSDVAAGITVQSTVIGRPSNTGGVNLLAKKLADLPEDRKIIIVGERDQKPDGRWPGREGAISVAEKLANRLGRSISRSLPPVGSKDLRDWFSTQRASRFSPSDRRSLFLDHLEEMKVLCSAEKDSSAKRDGTSKSPLSSRMKNRPSATTSPILPRYSGRNCRRGIQVVQQDRRHPTQHRSVLAPCRSRSCPDCRSVWVSRHVQWATWLFSQHEDLHVAVIQREQWRTFYRRVLRKGGEYWAAEFAPGRLIVFSTVAVEGTNRIGAEEAITQATDAVAKARPVPRPILSGQAWAIGRAEEEPDDLVGKEHDEPTADTLAQTPSAGPADEYQGEEESPHWTTVAQGKRASWSEIVAALSMAGVAYRVEQHLGVNLCIQWQINPGMDPHEFCEALSRAGGGMAAVPSGCSPRRKPDPGVTACQPLGPGGFRWRSASASSREFPPLRRSRGRPTLITTS